MGQDFSECWASAWPAIGAAFRSALAGTTAFLEDQRMFLDRRGYLEETFFTFSFSPIRDESGQVAGLFHPVTETTSKIVAERRTRTLRDIAIHALKAQSIDEGLRLAAETLAEAALDLPFVLFYRVDPDGKTATLAAQTGLPPGGPASPATLDLTAESGSWPLAEAALSLETVRVADVRERFRGISCGPYPEPIESAFVQPITTAGHERPVCIMVAGVSTRLPMNEAYRTFYDLLLTAVTTVTANAIAFEVERQRAEALAEIDRAKTAFFNNVSHEFRTPLTLLLGPLEDELAERTAALPPARRERLQTAHRNSLRLLKLVNALLDFARLEAGRVQAVYEPTDLAALTAELAGNFRSACERAGLLLRVECPPLPQPVYVDRGQWEKIVLNLLSNAFKFTFEGGIAVSLTPCGEDVELAVRDTGTGIPPAELPRIFERFHRVEGAQGRTHEGTGIGLALVRELATQHGGSSRAVSAPGKGSTFSVSIPFGKAHLAAARIGAAGALAATALGASPFVEEALRWLPAAATPPRTEPAEAGRRPRIVWADDNADMRDYVLRLLSDRYDVEAVADGAAALAAVRRVPPALVLCDVMMPRLDGVGLLRELRADGRLRTIPIILLSARAGEESRIEGLEAGADDYLVKPFSARELLARVGAHVELAALRSEAEAARGAAERAKAVQALNAELEQRVAKRTAELDAKNRELETFTYSVSHDLKAPLRGIDGYSRLLLEDYAGRLDGEGRTFLQNVRDGTAQMGRLIDDLLEYSRIERRPLEAKQLDLGQLVARLLAEHAGEVAARGARVTVDVPAVAVSADPEGLAMALRNLLGNALKFTGSVPEPAIEIAGRCCPASCVLSVRDNGAGFDMKFHDRIFEIFQRLHRAEDFPGTGVGLAIVRKAMERMGGRAWAESEPGKGATFFVEIPR